MAVSLLARYRPSRFSITGRETVRMLRDPWRLGEEVCLQIREERIERARPADLRTYLGAVAQVRKESPRAELLYDDFAAQHAQFVRERLVEPADPSLDAIAQRCGYLFAQRNTPSLLDRVMRSVNEKRYARALEQGRNEIHLADSIVAAPPLSRLTRLASRLHADLSDRTMLDDAGQATVESTLQSCAPRAAYETIAQSARTSYARVREGLSPEQKLLAYNGLRSAAARAKDALAYEVFLAVSAQAEEGVAFGHSVRKEVARRLGENYSTLCGRIRKIAGTPDNVREFAAYRTPARAALGWAQGRAAL